MHDRINQQFTLKNGFKLGFAEFGDPNGKPVFFFHGNPQSRLSADWIHKSAEKLQIRLIAPISLGLVYPIPSQITGSWIGLI